ncbi:hypothetical protein CW676_00630 [Macrococcoides caseolyticum]|uniref:hypothetical protein n=1 Tax=Macrococcoides caseolyticum TaxID=69966 RepID=UPI000C3322A4|nr:hypothetical protein [Macrococcus caseolyticus]PKE07885.1 hypothetical protein CW692_00685 [Macrococcus caseolyticus]PKE24883.1 hypothetical protein CW689_00020 [Macrococcus caseolyticus]PKE54541.1 hypothetical protein CW676_00630 [Macrococcus caseolyticus]PKF39406.1 hypothetical protein CW681_01910 [Macrococcus caseolyticus]
MNYIFISTTSKHDTEFLELPKKYIFNTYCRNVLITHKDVLITFLLENNDEDILFVIDCETKQGISLFDIAKAIKEIKCIPYKPNDITLEAADLSVLNYFNNTLTNLNIGIFGTGNISTKLAIRFAERNANIYLLGRDKEKVVNIKNIVDQMTFNQNKVHIYNQQVKLDCFVSFVSANEAIDSTYLSYLDNDTLCLDGGIGNFSKDFIAEGNEKGLDIRRVDVRMGDVILEGHIKSLTNNPFLNCIGRKEVEGIILVGGGIIGKENDVIVDNISNPKTVIGLADGFGGVKRRDCLSDIEKERIHKINEYIRESQ